jgi:hypothetical protein
MADCYLRKEIGSNVFKKMKDPAQSRYYNIKSAYYDYAWQYGVGQNVSQNKAYTPRGGAAGSGSSLPIDAFDQNATSMDKLREQMGTGKATTYIANIAKIDEELKGYVSTTRAKELKEEKDMNLKALYTMSRTQAGRTEIIGDLTSVFKDRTKALAYYEGMIEKAGTSATGVPYASTKTEQADVYVILKGWRDTPYLIDNAKDKAIIDSYINKIEYGHPILDKDLPELLTIVAKYNTPENHARSEENAYYASKKNELYDMLKGENNGLTPSQNNYYWTIYNNINKGYALDENQRDAMDKLYPEYRESVVKVDEKITSENEKTKTLLANSGKETNDEIIKGSIAKTLENSGKDEAKAYAMFLASSGLTDPGIPFRTNDDANVAMQNQTINLGPKEENKSWFDQPGLSLNFQGVTLIDWNPVEWMYGSWDEYKQKQDLGQQQHEAAWDKWSGNWIVNSLLLRNSEAWSKTITGTDPKTGEKAVPTRGDNLIVATDIASFIFSPYLEKATSWAVGKIADKAGPYIDDITKTTPRFSTDTTARVPGGTKVAKEATEEVTEQTAKTAKTLRADTLGNKVNNLAPEDRWALDKIRNIKTDIDTIGGKNYMRYTIGKNRFNSIDDATTWVNVQRDILKASGQADEAGKFVKAGTEELAKETIKTTSKEVTKETTKESGRLSLPIFKELPTWAKLSTAGFLFKEGFDLVGEYGFAGFITADTLMQFDSFAISDNMKGAKDPAAAAAALWARQWKYDNLLEPQANKVAWIQDNLPILPQVFELMKPTWDTAKDSRDAFNLDGRRYSEQLAYRGLWKGDWESGRPTSAEEIVAWYDANKNNKSIFPNSGAYDYNNAVPHSFYTNLKKDANARTEYNTRLNYMTFNEVNREIDKYNENVKIGRKDKLTTPEELKGKDDKQGGGGAGSPKGFGAMTGLGVGQSSPGVIPGKSISDRINTLLGDKTLDKFQIRTLGETFKIPGVDQLNNLLNSDKIQEAKEYLSNKLAEVVPGYKPYEKSAWSTPGSNYKPDRSGICLSACQNACQTAQVYRSNNCGSSQFSAFKTGSGSGGGGGGSVLLCGGGEAHGGGECREYGCDAVAESRAILCGEGTSCGSKQVVGCVACENAAEILPQIRCGERSDGGSSSCPYDLSGYNISGDTTAGGLPVEVTPTGNVPMQYCSGGSEICSQSESCDSSDVEAAQASCQGCETVWQMGCMSKELGMRKKK